MSCAQAREGVNLRADVQPCSASGVQGYQKYAESLSSCEPPAWWNTSTAAAGSPTASGHRPTAGR